MNGSTRTLPVAICLWVCLAAPAWGQAALPTEYDMRMARQRMEEALGSGKLPKDFRAPSVPKVESLPKPEAMQADIARIADGYRQFPATSNRTGASDSPELMIFVSFSMPRESLERIVIQSEKTGAVLVLRGFNGSSMARMGEEIAKLIGKRNVTAIIHPPAFTQFKVTQVPALVLAKPSQATRIDTDGCATPTSYIKVDGDVTQGYALDLIERQAPTWADAARQFSLRLAGRKP
jgi:conjugal transfer pilus assembly protein TrbC